MERITLFYVWCVPSRRSVQWTLCINRIKTLLILMDSGLIVGSSYLTSSYDTSLAFRHPFQSGIILLFLVGFCITFAEKYRLASPPPPIPSPAKPDDRFDKPLQSPRPRHFLGHGSRWRVRIAFAFLVLCLCQRVQVTRAWFKRVRCSSISVEVC